MNKKVMLLIPVLIGVMYLLPLMSAAVAVIEPLPGANLSGTFLINCTYVNVTDVTDPTSAGTTFRFNSTGTFSQIFSTRTGFAVVENTVYAWLDTNEVADGTGSIRCMLGNATTSLNWSNGTSKDVTIDDTAPTTGLSIDTESLSSRDTILLKWAYADATSGIERYSNVTITSPDSDECPVLTEIGVSGEDALTDFETSCGGVYTIASSVTDYAGNTNNETKTFKVSIAGKNKVDSNLLGGTGKSSLWKSTAELPLGEAGTDIAILAILGIAFYYLLKKK